MRFDVGMEGGQCGNWFSICLGAGVFVFLVLLVYLDFEGLLLESKL